MKTLVSILIPAYNAEKWIGDTIQSAIAQSWQRKEIIIVDDGSRDATAEVAQRFASKDVAVLSSKNQGAAAARNCALGLSQGDYIQWLDADDLLAPDKIERQLAALREVDNKRILLSSPWGYFNYRTRRARFVATSLWQDLSPVEWLLRKMGENLHMQTATWLTSRQITEAAGPWDTRLSYDDDGEYFCRVLLASEVTRFVPESRVFYRMTPSSTRLSHIGSVDIKKRNSLFLSMKLHIHYLRSLEESERIRKACLAFLQNKYIYFYLERPEIVTELQSLAAQLQGHLDEPRLRSKYSWMKPILGFKTAKRAQILLPQLKGSLVRRWDGTMYWLETRKANIWEFVGLSRVGNRICRTPETAVALLTGGGDRPYALGLAKELISKGAALDLIGSDDLDCPEFHHKPGVNFLNLRGDQRTDVNFARKVFRLSTYYAKLIRYAATAKPRIFHILWNNKFLYLDRTLLTLYYRLLGKRIVLTVHNVNMGRRDSKDTRLNRLTLRIQYRLADHIFVHTEKMKLELIKEFGVQGGRVTVIPFGINNAVSSTYLTPREAKLRLGLGNDTKAILFFGNIAPYKGLEYLITAFQQILARHDDYRLIIAGRPKNSETYWATIQEAIHEDVQTGRVLLRADFVPDDETEVYFKAADVLALPYRHIYQSGVLFLAYSFGLPVLAANVGSLQDEIVEGKTGFVFKPEDALDLAMTIERYFASDLFARLDSRRQEIRDYAAGRHSWDVVGQMTTDVYASLQRPRSPREQSNCEASKSSFDVKPS
jgi:glycosyltransferase involved in cell wall biosynthesis/GT2 family glycosyltransferase